MTFAAQKSRNGLAQEQVERVNLRVVLSKTQLSFFATSEFELLRNFGGEK
jgi:hypothetical protein